MKFTFISEDHPQGLEVDWPSVPGTGDYVAFRARGGTSALRVDRVEWEHDAEGKFACVEVHLTY